MGVKSRLRYVKATVGHKAQMDVQRSMSGVQIQVPRGWCCAPRVLVHAGSIQVKCMRGVEQHQRVKLSAHL